MYARATGHSLQRRRETEMSRPLTGEVGDECGDVDMTTDA